MSNKRRRIDLEVVHENPGAALPFIVYQPIDPWFFRSFDPEQDIEQYEVYDRGTTQRPDYALVGHADGFARDNTLDDQPEGFTYVAGKAASSEYHGAQQSTLVVGVFNRTTNKLQLMPMAGNRVYRLETRLDNIDYGTKEHEAADAVQQREQITLQNRQLVDSFGSTRRMRQMKAVSEGRVTGKRDGQAGQEKTQENTKGLVDQSRGSDLFANMSREQVQALAAGARRLPPHHVEATSPHDAYRIDELVPSGAWRGLNPDRLLAATEDEKLVKNLREKRLVPEYVLSRLPLLRGLSGKDAMLKAQAMDYLAALIHLFQARPSLDGTPAQLSRSLRLHQDLVAPLLETFFSRGGAGDQPNLYERDPTQKERLGLYILAVALLVEGGLVHHTEFEVLRAELKQTAPEALTRYRELGCACEPTTYEVIRAEGQRPESMRSFNVSLLMGKQALEGKTLRDCLPAVKLVRAMPKGQR